MGSNPTPATKAEVLVRTWFPGQGFVAFGGRVTGDVYRVVIARGADLRLRANEAGRRLPARRTDERGELLGCGRAHAWEQVLVRVHRERRMGVAEPFADDLDRYAGGHEQ